MRPALALGALLALAACATNPAPLPPQTIIANRLIIPRICRAQELDWRDAVAAADAEPEQPLRLLQRGFYARTLATCIAQTIREA